LTLIELMVAMAIGLVLVLSMLVLYVNIARNQAQLGNTGRQVENGKFALQLLQDDVRHASNSHFDFLMGSEAGFRS
jgi:type IV pilus assembly protein PilW